ncbi:peptide/nickel transport system permease protein [Bacillus oleivorans]|uniref:Peptide/nickel transport system permease protein n=1 Tax=Bacillus oleivorans TaxID=1448271 RepID=A0A285CHW6_9BACI|nr:ABC transporter permease [Bacillus oleivorans]SNX67192.1 peptide/nickel transport system permease protein [Bacillus oleivorans]
MYKYLLKRLFTMLLTLFGVSILVFLMVHFIPGDPVLTILGEFATEEAIRNLESSLGLDQPLYIQYLNFIFSAIQGDLGTSYLTGIPVLHEIINRFPITFQLSVYSLLVGSVVGIVMGTVAAVKQNTIFDRFAMVISLIGISAPGFWIALFLIYIFSYQLGLFPISGYEGVYSLILPSITLGLGAAGNIARMARSSLLEVIKQDYMRTAEAKGANGFRMILGHGLQNAFIPVITVIGLQFGSLLAGAVVTETVFALPGIGSLAVDAIATRDMPTIQGLVLFMAFMFILVNLLVDIIYSFIDPRIKYE